MRRLTRRRQVKKRSKHSRKYNKTRRGKYIKKRRSVSRRRVLRGGVLILRPYQTKWMNEFFDSLNHAEFDDALFMLDSLYSSLGQEYFIDMLGSNEFKERYNKTFYNNVCFAKLLLIKFLSYIYANVSNGNTITKGNRILHFTPGIFKKVNRLKSSSTLKSSGIFKPSSSGRFKSSNTFKSSSAVKHTSEGSVIWMLLALLCGADARCLNTTSYVADEFKSREGRELLLGIHNNLTILSSSVYLDKNTKDYITTVILPSMVIDEYTNKLGFNTSILCSILKGMLHIGEEEEADVEVVREAVVEMDEAD